VAASAAISFSNGDTVAIKFYYYYLGSESTVNGNVTSGITAPAVSTLWVVTSIGTGWHIKNLQTGKYLTRSGNSLQVGTTATVWTIYAGDRLRDGTRGITCDFSGVWALKNNGGDILSIDKYTKAHTTTVERSLVLSPASMTFPMSASSQEFTPTATTTTTAHYYYTCGTPGTDIQLASESTTVTNAEPVSYELTSSYTGFSLTNLVNRNATVNATKNTTTGSKTATLTATSTFPDGIVVTAQAAITQSSATFIHKRGASGRALQPNGMQSVHTLNEVVYMKAGTTRILGLPVPTGGGYQRQYYRWYDYDTDLDAGAALTHTTTYNYMQAQIGTYGDFMIHGYDPGITSYTMPSTFVKKRMAVDVSRNTDYVASNTFTEPTLSYRVIYDIRNASEMATALSSCSGDTFLEEYTIVAPTGTTISIGPKYKYTGEGNNYFVNASDPTLITTPQWKAGSTVITNPTVIDSRLIQPPVITTPQTVVYTLTANSRNIARFTVIYKDLATVGPVRETSGKAIITNDELDERYTLVAKRTFDYTDGGTGNYYPNPLPWDEVTYGFDYRTSIRYGAATTDWGEYNLMRTTTGCDMSGWLYSGVENRGGGCC